jgi:hypothetical protein
VRIEDGVAFRLHPKEGIVHQSNSQRVWTPPPAGWAKLNTDTRFYIDTGKVSTGVVVQDMNGKVLLSAWRSLNHMDLTPDMCGIVRAGQGL